MLLLGAAVRLAVVPRQPLWADELFSLAMATGHSLEQPADASDPRRGDFVESRAAEPPEYYARYLTHDTPPAGIGRVLRAVALSDTSPPLYYVVLWAWTRLLGSGDVALRLLSVAASLLALWLVAAVARRAGGQAAVLPAAALFALSPIGVAYSTEGRMYAFVFAWTAALLLLALHLRARGPRRGLLAALALVSAGGLLTHYFFAPVLAATAGWLFLRPGRCRRGPPLLGLALGAVLVLPWYAGLPASAARWRVTGGWLKLLPSNFDPLWTRLQLPWSLLSARAAEGLPAFVDYLNGAALLALLLFPLARRGRRLFAGPRALPWIVAVAGAVTPLAADAVLGAYTAAHPRYALAALPALSVALALLVAALRPRRRAFVMALLLALGLAGTFRVQRAPSRVTEPFAEIGAWLAGEADARDVAVVHSIPSVVAGVARYELRAGAGRDAVPIASWVGPLRRREVPADIESLASGRRRVLLVKLHTVADAVPEEGWLRAHARLAGERSFEKSRVLVFCPRQGDVFVFSSEARRGGEVPR